MDTTTKFLLDSGNVEEYQEIAKLAQDSGSQLWGATTNPTLIAKNLSGQKVTEKEAFELQKKVAMQILEIVPGAVSSEVYADEKTSAQQMIGQGREIASWHPRIVVKLPTTLEGLKARTTLRKEKIKINNTLVFSQAQIYAICLHEYLVQKFYGPTDDIFPPFISPFVGRLDDIGQNGMDVVEAGMMIKALFKMDLPKSTLAIWMLESSVRSLEHVKKGIESKVELITAPAKVYKEWFETNHSEQVTTQSELEKRITYFDPGIDITTIASMDEFYELLTSKKIDIDHELTKKGIEKFVQDWRAVIS